MKLHPREASVHAAENELRGLVLEVVQKHELTEGEALRVVFAALGSWVQMAAKYMIREERHPGQPDKPGGFE